MVPLAQLQEVPPKSMILLVGAPGSGKTTFCQQVVLQNLAMYKPIIYVTADCGTAEAENALKEKGLGEIEPGLLNFVDSYNETVGLTAPDRTDTVLADSTNLSSIGIAISKLQERIGKKGILLVFDSLTSPYLLSGSEVIRFMRLTLSRFAGEGNSVLACFDEGSCKEEDLVAMMSLPHGVIKTAIKKNMQFLDIVKHPELMPTRIEVPVEPEQIGLLPKETWGQTVRESASKMVQGKLDISLRTDVEDYVNVFWFNLAFWSGMLWDPKRFPELTYEVNKKHGAGMKDVFSLLPWHRRLLFKLFMPKNFSKVKDMKKMLKFGQTWEQAYGCIIEYLDQISRIDEHTFRMYESSECWVFQNVGATMAAILPPIFAGVCKGLESWRGLERDWNAVETKCVGLGDPYCEFKLIPGKTDELRESLVKDVSVIGRIHERLMNRLMGFLIDGKPLIERPKLGSNIHIRMAGPVMGIPIMAGERYQMAWRLGGAKMGKEVGERLIDGGLSEDEAEKRILSFLEHCKVGKVTVAESIKVEENCEPLWIVGYTAKWKEPCCFFTTGFFNGFFSAVKNQHVKETKCIAMGDPYCEWEFR